MMILPSIHCDWIINIITPGTGDDSDWEAFGCGGGIRECKRDGEVEETNGHTNACDLHNYLLRKHCRGAESSERKAQTFFIQIFSANIIISYCHSMGIVGI